MPLPAGLTKYTKTPTTSPSRVRNAHTTRTISTACAPRKSRSERCARPACFRRDAFAGTGVRKEYSTPLCCRTRRIHSARRAIAASMHQRYARPQAAECDHSEGWEESEAAIGRGGRGIALGQRHRRPHWKLLATAAQGKLQRLQDDRSRAEQAVLKEDSRAGLRQAGRLRLYAEQMQVRGCRGLSLWPRPLPCQWVKCAPPIPSQAYNNNLQMDDRSTARWIADVHPQARYQASGDLLKQSLLIIQQKAAVDAERKRQTAESETLPTKPRGPLQQYSRLPFVGR